MTEQHTAKVRIDERTLYEAKGDAAYAIRYLHLQERLFLRMSHVFKFVSLLGGSAAFVGAATASPALTGFSGILVAASTILDFVIKPEEASLKCRTVKHKYQKLLAKAETSDLPEFSRKLAKISLTSTPHIEGLRRPAYNDSCHERGRPDFVLPLSNWEKFVSMLA
ncbi:hypothetical protein [Vreelandella titanicae]|uniref:SMODS and SLOG-associating 2TM effector domain-containing protein n=1 Tax=Vreelandella titanicae BH1 TaxID=1204738 RepID=L9UBF4_9GAMM|nr:hypothetical protein [Halomonas titanicae]ELY22295.1 hypothetical protein HALTITAN_0871 [Halomonas titanicae BH1]